MTAAPHPPESTPHPEVVAVLPQLTLGELEEKERLRVEQHLLACPACAHHYAELRQVFLAVKDCL